VLIIALGWRDSGQTDASGRLELCAPPRIAPDAPLIVEAQGQKRAGWAIQAQGQQELTVQLLPLPAIRGRVLPMGGPPVKRFHLEVSGLSADFLGDQFELHGVRPGRSWLNVTVDDGRRALAPIDVKPGVDARLEVPVYAGVTLTGRIIDAATGVPVGGVEVFVSPFNYTMTTQDGRFTFRDLTVGEHQLELSRRGVRVSQTVKLVPGQAHDLGDIALAP
jgi:hypothetical protein